MITMQAITLEVDNRQVTLSEKELVDIVASYYASQEKAARDAKLVAEREERDRQIMQTKPKQVLTALEGQKIVLVQVSDDGKAVVIYSDTDSADEETDGESDVDNSDVDIGEDADEADIEEEFDDYCSKDTSDNQASSEASSSNSGESVSSEGEDSTCNSGNSNVSGTTTSKLDENFPIVDIESISLDDKFMQYVPITKDEKRVMNSITHAKDMGLKNFRRPKFAVSFSKDRKQIAFVKGADPACGKPFEWWKKVFRNFMPELNSRISTDLHEDVFLGTLIKYLVEEEGWRVAEAWRSICRDSRKHGLYSNSGKIGMNPEKTGTKSVGKWCDLMGVCKIVERYDSPSECVAISGRHLDRSSNGYLAIQRKVNNVNGGISECSASMIMDVKKAS